MAYKVREKEREIGLGEKGSEIPKQSVYVREIDMDKSG